MNTSPAAPVAIALTLALAACTTGPGTPPDNAWLNSTVERAEPDSPHVTELARGLNDAGYDIFHAATATSDEDVALSPVSIGVAFGMLDVGATGGISESLDQLFRYPVAGEERWAAFNTLEQHVSSEVEDADGSATVRLANRAFQDTSFTPVPEYNEAIARWFGAGIESLELQAQPQQSTEHINAMVADRTEGLIENFLPPTFITQDTAMVLINAVYLKAQWGEEFDPALTKDADFTRLDGTTSTVPLMRLSDLDTVGMEGAGFAAAELPYADEDLSMLVIVPDEGRFEEVQAQLGSDFIDSLDAAMESTLVDVALPRFNSGGAINLREAIEDGLGITGIFGVEGQLDGIGQDLTVAGAIHEAKVIVNEEGTEAAAATGIGFEITSAPMMLTLHADQPFIYLIRDTTTGAVLFLGRVLDPAA